MPTQQAGPDGKIYNFPDDASPAEIAEFMAAIKPAGGAGGAGAGGGPTGGARATAGPPPSDWVDMLPSALGFGASLLGGSKALPTGVAASALGGAAGEAARQLIRLGQGRYQDVPQSSGEAFKRIVSEAGGQAGMEGIGRGVGAALTPVAKGVYYGAVRPAFHIAREAAGAGAKLPLITGMNRIIKEGFENRVMPTMSGGEKTIRLVDESVNAADNMATSSTKRVPTMDLLTEAATDQATRMKDRYQYGGVDWRPGADVVAKHYDEILRQQPTTMSASEVVKLRRVNDDIADELWKAGKAPNPGKQAPPGTLESGAASVGDAARANLNRMLGDAFKQQNATTMARQGLRKAIDQAAARPSHLATTVGVGAGATSYNDPAAAIQKFMLTRGALDPRVMAAGSFVIPSAGRWGARAVDPALGGEPSEALAEAIRKMLFSEGGEAPPPEQ